MIDNKSWEPTETVFIHCRLFNSSFVWESRFHSQRQMCGKLKEKLENRSNNLSLHLSEISIVQPYTLSYLQLQAVKIYLGRYSMYVEPNLLLPVLRIGDQFSRT